MKYVIRNTQDLETLLNERCVKEQEIDGDWEWNGMRWYGCDVIILGTGGQWFDKDIVSKLCIWEGSIVNCIPATKLRLEDRQAVINTISYIQENFDHIYQVMLETLLPTLMQWKMQNFQTNEPVITVQQLHDAHNSTVFAGMESGCITNLQLNCQYQKDNMVFYSLTYQLDSSRYGYDDGFEVVFWRDHVVFFGDGNPQEYIFRFEDYKNASTYFGI